MKQKNGMPLAQAAAEDIIEMIRTNHMKPGDRLENEYELAKKLNVGRSTVREAVKSLETRNILTIKRGAGTFISQNEGVAVDPLGISLMGKDEEMALELLLTCQRLIRTVFAIRLSLGIQYNDTIHPESLQIFFQELLT